MSKSYTKQFFDNLFKAPEQKVINDIFNAMKEVSKSDKIDNQDYNEIIIRNIVKVAKRLYDENTISVDTLYDILINNDGKGCYAVDELARYNRIGKFMPAEIKENSDMVTYFRDDYYTGATGQRNATKTYEYTIWTRNQMQKLVDEYHNCLKKRQTKARKQNKLLNENDTIIPTPCIKTELTRGEHQDVGIDENYTFFYQGYEPTPDLEYKSSNLSFGRYIQNLRITLNLSEQELAYKLGISPEAIVGWEANELLPDIGILPRLADELQITLSDLMSFNCYPIELPRAKNDPTKEITFDEDNKDGGVDNV